MINLEAKSLAFGPAAKTLMPVPFFDLSLFGIGQFALTLWLFRWERQDLSAVSLFVKNSSHGTIKRGRKSIIGFVKGSPEISPPPKILL